jgi:hypothetical protein
MSTPESTTLDRTASESLPTLPDALRLVTSLAVRPVRFVAFWLATLLPFAYLPLLATGAVAGHGFRFAGLVGINAVAFVVGHGHNEPE